MKTFLVRVAALVAVAGIAVACGGGDQQQVVVTETVATEAPAATVTATAETVTETVATTTQAAPPKKKKKKKLIRVPNLVGVNHQDAQDRLQALGLYNLHEEDATGQGRFLFFDSNWVVVRQQPAPGRRVGENAPITLFSKKIGE